MPGRIHYRQPFLRLLVAVLATIGTVAAVMADGGKPRGIVVAVTVEPPALFSPTGGGTAYFLINTKILERLVRQQSAADFGPELAESWSVRDGGKAFAFKLRQTTWHDHQSFTSADVKFTIEQVMKPNSSDPLIKSIVGIDTPSDDTAIIRFAQPRPEYLVLASLASPNVPILPRHLYEGTRFADNPANGAPVGTGPFMFGEWVRGSHVTLRRNPSYWDAGRPTLAYLTFRFLRDSNARAAALEAGEVQLAVNNPFPAAEIRRLAKVKSLDVNIKGFETVGFQALVEMNTRNAILAKTQVRQAIAHAIDRKFVANVVFALRAEPATGPLPHTSKFYTADVSAYAFDPKLSAKMLDEAGFPARAKGHRFALRLVVSPTLEENRLAGQYVKQALGDVGINVGIETPDAGEYGRQIYCNHDFDLTIGNSVSGADPLLANAKWYSTEGTKKCAFFANAHGLTSPEMDRLLDAAGTQTVPAKRAELLDDFQRLAMQQLPILPLVDVQSTNVSQKNVVNVGDTSQWLYDSWKDLAIQ